MAATTAAELVGAVKNAGWPVRNVVRFLTETDDGVKRDTAGAYSGGPLRPYHNKVSDYVGVQVRAAMASRTLVA